MADVFEVADFFIDIANRSEDDQITNLKLNKLLYYAQGAFLARTGQLLFDDEIEAWDLGPVVPEIYRRYKVCGKMPIASEGTDINISAFTEEEMDAMLDVAREFGQYTGAKLVSMTHRPNTPWSETRRLGEKVISNKRIKQYFTEHPVTSIGSQINLEEVTVLPSDWYDPAEDAEWEAYL